LFSLSETGSFQFTKIFQFTKKHVSHSTHSTYNFVLEHYGTKKLCNTILHLVTGLVTINHLNHSAKMQFSNLACKTSCHWDTLCYWNSGNL